MYSDDHIDTIHKWLPNTIFLASIKISLTNFVFDLMIQKNLYAETSQVRLIYE